MCRYAGGDSIKHTVFDNVDRATLKVYSSQENVAGVKIPKFESASEPGETKMELTGTPDKFTPQPYTGATSLVPAALFTPALAYSTCQQCSCLQQDSAPV